MDKIQRLEKKLNIYENGVTMLKQYLSAIKWPDRQCDSIALLLHIQRVIEQPLADFDEEFSYVFAGYTQEELAKLWARIAPSLRTYGEYLLQKEDNLSELLIAAQYFCEEKSQVIYNVDNGFTRIFLYDIDKDRK